MPGLIAAGSSGPAAVPFSMSYRCQVSRRMFAFTGASADKPTRRAQPKRGVRQAQSQLTAGFARPGAAAPGPLKKLPQQDLAGELGPFFRPAAPRGFSGHPRPRWTPAQQRGTPGAGNASRRPGTGHPTPPTPDPPPGPGPQPHPGCPARGRVSAEKRRARTRPPLGQPRPAAGAPPRPSHPVCTPSYGGRSVLTARKPGPRTPEILWAETETGPGATGARCRAGGDGEDKRATSFSRGPRFRAERVGIG